MTTDLGRVGVWWAALAGESAEAEREAAAELEEAGWGTLWIGEVPGRKEILTHAALLLSATSKMNVATGIANIYARDAVAARDGAYALSGMSDGRFVLGLGVSHAPIVELRGSDYGKPVTAMREYLDGFDVVPWSATEVPPVTTLIGALRPKMLELSRDRTDGAHPYFVPVSHTARAREVIGAEKLLAPELTVVLESDPAKAREKARQFAATYLGLPNYVNNLLSLGYTEQDVADGGSDRLIDDVIAWGDVDAIAARVKEHFDAGADHVCVQPFTKHEKAREWLRELRPALAEL